MEFTPIKVAFNDYGLNQTVKEYNNYKNHFQIYIDKIMLRPNLQQLFLKN